MDKTGNFWGKPNKKLIFDIHDVMAINKLRYGEDLISFDELLRRKFRNE